MKIRNISKENITGPGILEREGKNSPGQVLQTFGEQLHKVQGQLAHERLEGLLAEIDKQGRALGESLNLKDLLKYKELIQKFLDYAVNKMYHLKEQSGWDRRGRHKIYTIVETVNRELENLTTMLISEQKDKISILAKVDDIRGLLIDIYS